MRVRLPDHARAALASFSLLGLFGWHLKTELMNRQWTLAARLFTDAPGAEPELLQRLGFFADDLLVNFLLIPLAGTLLILVLPRRLRLPVLVFLTVSLALLYFVQLRAFFELGQYLSAQLLAEAVVWTVSNPAVLAEYLPLVSAVKLLVFLGLLLLVALGPLLPPPRAAASRHLFRWHRGGAGLLAVGAPVLALLLLPPFWSLRQPQGAALNRSAVEQVIAALQWGEEGFPSTFDRPVPEILDLFRRQTSTPPLDPAAPLVGAERGADVLLFVMETIPSAVLELPGADRDLPGIGRLFGRSFVSSRHYTTYPYTSDAVYSLLSGWYPQGRRKLLNQPGILGRSGLMNILEPQGYRGGVYAPSVYSADLDDRMYAAFGAARIFYATDHPEAESRARAVAGAERLLVEWEGAGDRPFPQDTRAALTERLVLDLQALEEMKRDIVATKRAGRNFCALFLPQIGHAPWLNPYGRDEVRARGRDLARLQDRWLAEILDLLDANGWLESTVVVLTADHGIRTRTEDPALPSGTLSSYMLQVPLLLYAPRSLREPTLIEVPTSHIDITPTLLALLGETSCPPFMQGIPLWQRAVDQQVYFFGSGYVGADGFVQDGAYYMQHRLSGGTFRADRLAFDSDHLLPPGLPETEEARRVFRDTGSLQLTLIQRLLEDGMPGVAPAPGPDAVQACLPPAGAGAAD